MKYLLLPIVILLIISCQKDQENICIDVGMSFQYQDMEGPDLLDISINSVYSGGPAEVYSFEGNGNKIILEDNQVYFDTDINSNILLFYPYYGPAVLESVNYINFSNKDIDTVKCFFDIINNNIFLKEAFYNETPVLENRIQLTSLIIK